MKTRLLCFLMVLALLPCLALAEDAPQKLVVAEPVHLIDYLPLYVAIHEGYFADEGLDVMVVQATGGAHVTAVVSGDAFAVIGGVDSNNFANQGNADPIVAIVNCVNRANVYLFARGALPRIRQRRGYGRFPPRQNHHCRALRRFAERADALPCQARRT